MSVKVLSEPAGQAVSVLQQGTLRMHLCVSGARCGQHRTDLGIHHLWQPSSGTEVDANVEGGASKGPAGPPDSCRLWSESPFQLLPVDCGSILSRRRWKSLSRSFASSGLCFAEWELSPAGMSLSAEDAKEPCSAPPVNSAIGEKAPGRMGGCQVWGVCRAAPDILPFCRVFGLLSTMSVLLFPLTFAAAVLRAPVPPRWFQKR